MSVCGCPSLLLAGLIRSLIRPVRIGCSKEGGRTQLPAICARYFPCGMRCGMSVLYHNIMLRGAYAGGWGCVLDGGACGTARWAHRAGRVRVEWRPRIRLAPMRHCGRRVRLLVRRAQAQNERVHCRRRCTVARCSAMSMCDVSGSRSAVATTSM